MEPQQQLLTEHCGVVGRGSDGNVGVDGVDGADGDGTGKVGVDGVDGDDGDGTGIGIGTGTIWPGPAQTGGVGVWAQKALTGMPAAHARQVAVSERQHPCGAVGSRPEPIEPGPEEEPTPEEEPRPLPEAPEPMLFPELPDEPSADKPPGIELPKTVPDGRTRQSSARAEGLMRAARVATPANVKQMGSEL